MNVNGDEESIGLEEGINWIGRNKTYADLSGLKKYVSDKVLMSLFVCLFKPRNKADCLRYGSLF